MQPSIRLCFSLSRETRHRSAYISTSFHVVEPMADVAADAGNAGAAIPASFLPKESLRLEKFEGNHSDRKYCASWIRRAQRIFGLLGYDDADWERKLFFASASLPNNKPAGRWYDSKTSTPATAFTSWDDFKVRFLARFGPTTADLNQWEQEFQRMIQTNQTVSDFAQSIDASRDVLASSDRVFDDVAVRQIFVAGLRPSVRQHVNSQIAVDNTVTYERCVEIACSHVDANLRTGGPRLQGMTGKDSNNKNKDQRSGKYCAYHKVTTHATEDCAVVRRLKAAGKWRGKPRPAN
jgi:hypothetical protein